MFEDPRRARKALLNTAPKAPELRSTLFWAGAVAALGYVGAAVSDTFLQDQPVRDPVVRALPLALKTKIKDQAVQKFAEKLVRLLNSRSAVLSRIEKSGAQNGEEALERHQKSAEEIVASIKDVFPDLESSNQLAYSETDFQVLLNEKLPLRMITYGYLVRPYTFSFNSPDIAPAMNCNAEVSKILDSWNGTYKLWGGQPLRAQVTIIQSMHSNLIGSSAPASYSTSESKIGEYLGDAQILLLRPKTYSNGSPTWNSRDDCQSDDVLFHELGHHYQATSYPKEAPADSYRASEYRESFAELTSLSLSRDPLKLLTQFLKTDPEDLDSHSAAQRLVCQLFDRRVRYNFSRYEDASSRRSFSNAFIQSQSTLVLATLFFSDPKINRDKLNQDLFNDFRKKYHDSLTPLDHISHASDADLGFMGATLTIESGIFTQYFFRRRKSKRRSQISPKTETS